LPSPGSGLVTARHDDDARGLVDVHELQVGPQLEERLGGVHRVGQPTRTGHHELAVLLALRECWGLRDGTGNCNAELALHHLRLTHSPVELAPQDGIAEAEQQAHDKTQRDVALHVRRDREPRQLRRLDRDHAERLDLVAARVLHRIDLSGKSGDPRIGEVPRFLRRAGPSADLDQDGVQRLGDAYPSDEAGGRLLEVEGRGYVLGGGPGLREVDVGRGARLGERVADRGFRRVVALARAHEATGVSLVDLRLHEAGTGGQHDPEQGEGDDSPPVGPSNAKVVGEFHSSSRLRSR
jgi:hypothetical protein